MSGYGYSGREYDRHCSNTEQSTIYKMKETYWTAKQAVISKLGKKQDEHVVASDAELDSKLEVFQAIQRSTVHLLRVIERYQDQLCALSREENAMGRMLKTDSLHDKTRAGKMMAAVGKAQCYSSQQILGVRSPLVRLYQEVETFRCRAITDTQITVNNMEAARTEYRGALMWMKDVSEVLDPDTSRQLQKFRAVQQQVKKTKVRFDKLKLDSMQKIDLLAASRCNMFSQVLVKYQASLLLYWSKTSGRMTAVAEAFKGYQYYDFSQLKELGEPAKKLAKETGAADDDDDESKSSPSKKSGRTEKSNKSSNKNQPGNEAFGSLLEELDQEFPPEQAARAARDLPRNQSSPPLLEFDDDDDDFDVEEIKRRQDEEFGLGEGLGKMKGGGSKKAAGDLDLLSDEADAMLNENKDDLTLLNEILSMNTSGTTTGSELESEWTAVFGESDSGPTGEPAVSPEHSSFMPSCLLELSTSQRAPPPGYNAAVQGMMGLGMSGRTPASESQAKPGAAQTGKEKPGPKAKKKDQKAEMSAWFNLFAELDPLANPDAIGRNQDDLTDA